VFAARASRVENQDAIDACIVGMLADPKEVSFLTIGSPSNDQPTHRHTFN